MDPNRPFREGEAELEKLLRWADREVRRSEAEAMDLPSPAPGAIPSDVTRAIFQTLQFLWSVRGPLLNEAMARARAFVGQGMPIRTAALLAGRQLNLPPRRVSPGRPGLTAQQVGQYHRRQQQRGRRPGQDPRSRRKQREAEEELF
jgi:hypothetical protein